MVVSSALKALFVDVYNNNIPSLQSLQFQSIVHEVTTIDCQLTVDHGLLVVVLGRLKVSLQAPNLPLEGL